MVRVFQNDDHEQPRKGDSMVDLPVVVTGARGFIGQALCRRLLEHGLPVIAVARRPAPLPPAAEIRTVDTIDGATDWRPLLEGGRAVIHLAARAHAPAAEDEEAWIAAESAAAAGLARAAREVGMERLVLVSSIKAHGEVTGPSPFRADQPLAPADPYGRVKARTEKAMRNAVAAGGPKLVVLRPPLVYGPQVKANFLRLLRLVDRGVPLPFRSINNRRSMIFLENLLDLIEVSLTHPAAPGESFLMRDAEEVSTPELVRHIARHLGRRARLLPCAPWLLRAVARVAGSGSAADRLVQSLSVDDQMTRLRLGWRPRFSLDEGLAQTCEWFRAT